MPHSFLSFLKIHCTFWKARKIYEPFLIAKSAIQVIGKVVWHGEEL